MPQEIIHHDVNGQCGRNGKSGNYPGGDGENGCRGYNGQDIDITLSVENGSITMVHQGFNDEHYPLFLPHTLYLSARGGQGGRGGDGGAGAPGRDGHDATQYSAGTSGGPGGDGGNGGNGGDGGDGGHIIIRVNEEDMDLLGLIPEDSIDIQGGAGGEGGRGGPGGPGGRGGAGYSWSETAYYSDGTSHTTYHSNPGGSNGRSGMPGTPGKPGCRGRDGSVQYVVTDRYNNQTTYEGPYLLRIVTFTITPSPDNINEPGETLDITHLVLRNAGEMPTPAMNSFVFYGVNADNSGWVTFDSSVSNKLGVQIPPQKPDELFQAGGTFPFSIKAHNDVATDETFRANTTVDIIAMLPRIQKVMKTYSTPQSLLIQYPVALTAINGKRAILRDEQPPIAFQLWNFSTISVGLDDHPPRALQVVLASSDPIFLQGANTQRQNISENGFVQAITLNSETHASFSGTLDLSQLNLPSYSIVMLTASLLLGKRTRPTEPRVIQKRTLSIQLAEGYEYHDNVDFTLVVNGQTTRDIMASWRNLTENQFIMDVWNTSLYNGVSYQYCHQKDRRNWMGKLSGKSVVILNNSFVDERGDTKRSTDYLNSTEIFEAAQYAKVHTYVIGSGFSLEQAIIPAGHYPATFCINKKDIVAAQYSPEAINAYFPARTSYTYQPKARGWFGRQPDQEVLVKKSNKLSKKLEKRFPERRYLTFFTYCPTVASNRIIFKNWNMGTIETRRGLDFNAAQVVHDQREDYQAVEADIYYLFKLMPFTSKLDKIALYLENDHLLSCLKKAILSDLADEQKVFRKEAWSGPLPKEKLRDRLSHFLELCAFDFSAVFQHEAGKQFLKELFLAYDYLVNHLPKKKDHFLFYRRARILTSICHEGITQWMKGHKKDLALPSKKLSNKQTKKIKRALNEQYKQTPPPLVLQQMVKPYDQTVCASVACQDNEVETSLVQDSNLLPPVREVTSTINEVGNYFATQAERQCAIDNVLKQCSVP